MFNEGIKNKTVRRLKLKKLKVSTKCLWWLLGKLHNFQSGNNIQRADIWPQNINERNVQKSFTVLKNPKIGPFRLEKHLFGSWNTRKTEGGPFGTSRFANKDI